MADENLDYEALTNEIAEKDKELTPERMVEVRKELEGVELADRNDDHTFVWNELAERAQAEIDRLADAPIEDLSADQLDALGNLVQEFSSHIENKYTGTAAVLKDKITARANLLAVNDDSPSLRLSFFYEKENLFSQEGMGKLLTELCAKEDFTPTLEEINRLSDLKESNDLSGDAKDAVEAKMFSTLEKMNSDENFKFSYRDMSDLQDILRHENENMSEDLKNSLSKAVEDIELSEIEFLEDMRTTLLHGQTFDGLTVDETKSAIWNALGDQDRDLSQLRDAWEGWTPEQRAEIKQKFAEGDKEVVEMLDGLAKRVPTEEIPEIQMEAGKDYIIDIENLPELKLGTEGYNYPLKLEDYKDMLSGLQPGERIVIGRTPENEDKSIPLDKSHPNFKYVSGKHAYIEMGEDGQLHLVDNNSTNGTIIKGYVKENPSEDIPEDEIIDDKDAAFLDSITDENKQEIIDRYNRLDDVAKEMGDVFAKDEDGNYKVSGEGFNFKGLESFFDNVYIDADIPENPDEKPSEELRNKRDWLKDETRELALNLALKDLLQDESIDEIKDKEKLKERLAEAVHDNMTFLTYSLVSTQAGFEALSESRNPDKMLPKDRQEFLSIMRDKSNDATRTVAAILSGTEKTAVKLTTPGITSTFAPYHLETKSFAKGLKEKTGIGKLWNRVQAFDDRMTKAHPILWGFAKSSAVSAAFGPVGIAAMVGHSTYKQFKMLNKEYKKQKAENGGEMKLWDFVKQNPGKVISATVGVVSTCLAAGTGLEAALGGNFGAVANVTGAMLSGDAPQAVSQISSISFNHIVESGKNLVQSVSEQGIDLQGVADGIRNSWTPMRTLRTAMNLGAGFAKASEAYMKAENGNKWSAAKKVFVGTVTGLVAGNALADLTAVAAQEFQQNQAYEHMKQEIEAGEKAFQQELENADFSDIKIPLPPDYTIEGGEVPEVTVTGHAHSHAASEPTTKIHLEEVEVGRLNTVEPEIKTPDLEIKDVYKVNDELVAVSKGETIEETLDNAREEYLNNHPEIDNHDNKVKIEGQGGLEATIKTEKEDIMASDGEAVLGQETEIDRKIEVGDIKIQDHIEKIETEQVQAEMQESKGRVDTDANNIIPDGAKILNTTHFKNDNIDITFTEYEGADGKVHITDGTNDRIAPANQSAEQRMETWKNMAKEIAEQSYQDQQNQATVVEEQKVTEAKETEVKTADAKVADAATNTDNATNTGTTKTNETAVMTDSRVQPASRAFDYGGELEQLQDPNVTSINEGWGFGESIIHHAGENAPKVDLGFGELTPVAEKVNDNMNTTTQVFLDAEGHRFDKVIDNSDGSYEILDGHSNQTGISGNIKDDKFKLDFTEEGLKVSPNDPQQDAKLAAQERAEDLANKVDEEKTMTDAEKINQLRQGKPLDPATKGEESEVKQVEVKGKAKVIDGDINVEVNSEELAPSGTRSFEKQAQEGVAASVADSTGSFTSSVAAASDEFSDFTSSAMDEFNNFTSSGSDDFGSFTSSAAGEFNNFTSSVADDYNNTVIANQVEYNQNTVAGIIEAGGHDYSAELTGMGLKNSQILSASIGESSREVTNGDTVTTVNTTYQTEFRQGNNGFAMVNNDQVRTVTVEGKNLHFQISENGHVRDMTANEAQQFCNDVKATGAKTEGFNNKLFNSVEGIKHVNDSRGISSYAPEPRGNSGGNVNIQTMQQTMGGGRKI